MKKNWLLVFVLVALFGFSDRLVSADTTLYRLYNPGLKVHLYTKDTNEYKVLGTRGWTREGTAWITADSGGDAVYRLYHAGLKVHLYTKDTNEYRVLATRGWTPEGVAFRSSGTLKIYRLYHEGLKKHLYTKDYNEYKVLGSRGWKQENVAFYGIDPNAQSPADKAKAALDQAKKDVAVAIANLSQAEQQLAQAKKADADRDAKIKAAETDVKTKSDAVTTTSSRVTAAQGKVSTTTDTLTKANDAVTKAQDALKNIDTVTIADGKQFVEDRKTGDSELMTDSGSTIIEDSVTQIGQDDKSKVINVNTLPDADKQELALYTLQVINAVRASQGLKPMQLTTGGMTAAKNQADKYITRDQLIQTAGHISGDYFGENVSNISKASATMYDIKLDIYNAIMTMAFNDAPSKWSHTTNMLSGASDLGVAFATFGGRTHIINVHGVYSGTPIANPNDPAKLQATLAKAQADQTQAQTASNQANATLTQASADYAAALDAKTQAEKVLASATATPLQTQVAENNLRLAKIALQNAQAREVEAQKAVDNFSADLATKKAKLDEAKAALTASQADAAIKATALETVKAELAKQQSTLDSLNKDKAALLAEKDSLVEEAKALATELKGYLEAPAILEKAKAELSDKEATLKEAIAKAEVAHNALKDLSVKLAEEESKLAELQAEYDKLKDLEDKAKSNVIATLPNGGVIAVPKDAPTVGEKPALDPALLVAKTNGGKGKAGVTVTPQGITYSRVARAKALPQTGEQESLLALFGVAVLSSLGLTGARRKRRG